MSRAETLAKIAADRRSPNDSFCTACGYSHAAQNRQDLLRRMLGRFDFGVSATFIREAWPCFYATASRTLWQDLKAIGAVRVAARTSTEDHADDFCATVWLLPAPTRRAA